MNTSDVAAAAEQAKRTCGAFINTLVDLGSTWAAYGLKVSKVALEQSAETLGKTAHALDALATELEAKVATDATKTDEAPKTDANGTNETPSA